MTNRWHDYFMRVAETVSTQSTCHSRQVGAVIVKDKVIISTGFNGPPRSVKHCEVDGQPICPRKAAGFKSGEGLHLCPAGHGERNAIVQAARLGIAVCGAKMYCYCGVPCKDCLIEIINAGIVEVITTSLEFYDSLSERLINESGLLVWSINGERLG